jgi:GNAT superfamily N-acetyltransferase
MDIKFEFVPKIPDPLAFENLMLEYYQVMVGKLVEAGGPAYPADDLVADTMAHLDDLLPPLGRTLLATNADGTILGCGVIRKIRPNAVELKRMYVRPAAQGLGRKLFEMRISEARSMGSKTIYADTVKGNTAMLSMYEKFGFSYIPRYPENANGPDLEPFLVYLKHVLP